MKIATKKKLIITGLEYEDLIPLLTLIARKALKELSPEEFKTLEIGQFHIEAMLHYDTETE